MHRSIHDNNDNNDALSRIDLQVSFYLYFESGGKETFKVKIAHNFDEHIFIKMKRYKPDNW